MRPNWILTSGKDQVLLSTYWSDNSPLASKLEVSGGGIVARSPVQISVIIVEYLSIDALERCFNSLRPALQSMTHEILVISNSSYGPVEGRHLKTVVASDHLVCTGANLGFAKGVNIGLRESQGEYVFLLNPDCTLADSGLEDAIRFLSQTPHIGILGPRIVDEQGRVQESARRFMTPLKFASRVAERFLGIRFDHADKVAVWDSWRSVDWVSGAAMLVRRSAIEHVGMMDERYFMYVEDMDWCRSFRFHGYDVVSGPYLTVRHAACRASSAALSSWRPSRLMWIHFGSYCKYMLKTAQGAWRKNL